MRSNKEIAKKLRLFETSHGRIRVEGLFHLLKLLRASITFSYSTRSADTLWESIDFVHGWRRSGSSWKHLFEYLVL